MQYNAKNYSALFEDGVKMPFSPFDLKRTSATESQIACLLVNPIQDAATVVLYLHAAQP